MIADALRQDIERYAYLMPTQNPVYVAAADGALTADHIRYHVQSARELVRHTPPHLARAIERSKAANRTELAEHFADKRAEEVGHDRWGDRDLKRLEERFETREDSSVSPAIRELIAFIERTIDDDPQRYLAYILFAEYLIVLLGPEWLALLEERCGIPASMVSIVGNHAELDREHAHEGFEAIDRLIGDPAMLEPMRDTLRDTIRLFDAFCADVANHAPGGAAPAETAPGL